MGYTSSEGLILTGQGSTNDVTIKNDADETVLSIPTGTQTVQIDGTTTDDFLVIKTTEAGASTAPDVVLYRLSSSPADDDFIGKLVSRGRNDNSQDVNYGEIMFQATDVSDGAEDGKIYLTPMIGGSAINMITLDSTGVGVASGYSVYTNTAGTSNYVAGVNAGNSIQSGGNYNVAVGDEAGTALTTGDNNVLIGYGAGDGFDAESNNVGIGFNALGGASYAAANNTAIGYNAGSAITSGASNVIIGSSAGDAVTTGSTSVIIGQNAGSAMTTASENVIVGNNAGAALTEGGQNILIGDNAGAAGAITGIRNVAVGDNALYSVVAGGGNIAIGYAAGDAITSGDNNVLAGTDAGTAITTGNNNTAIGGNALISEDESSAITAIGYNCGNNHNGGTANTMVGAYCADAVTTGTANTYVGDSCAGIATTGSGNTGLGHHALSTLTTGANNVGIGYEAGYGTGGTFNSSGNVFIGYRAGKAVTSADTCTAIGADALTALTTGNFNTAVGHECGDNITTGTYNICIGKAADPSAADGDFQIVIGTAIAGSEDYQFTFGTTNSIVQNEFDTDAAWTRTSDRRKKRNIQEDKLGLDFINDLKTVTYQWRPSNEYPKEWNEYSEDSDINTDVVMHGMIAQDIKQALDNAECDTFAGWKERKDGSQVMSREMFVIPLIKAVQELSTQVNELKDEIKTLKGK